MPLQFFVWRGFVRSESAATVQYWLSRAKLHCEWRRWRQIAGLTKQHRRCIAQTTAWCSDRRARALIGLKYIEVREPSVEHCCLRVVTLGPKRHL